MARRQQAADCAQRPKMRSPGRWGFPRRVEREFWLRIAEGVRTVRAAEAVGVSEVIGGRWFRRGGGMPPMSLAEPSGRYLSFTEREEIAILRAQGCGLGRSAAGSGVIAVDDLSRAAAQRGHPARTRNIGPRPRSGRPSRAKRPKKRSW